MTITRKEESDKIILSFNGWLDTQTTPELEAVLNELPKVKYLVFDFSELDYISSAGIRSVVAAFRKQKENGDEFEIKEANSTVMEVFQLTGLLKRIPVTEKAE